MPIVNCPDCGAEVSDKAALCPKCARPYPGAVDKNRTEESSNSASMRTQNSKIKDDKGKATNWIGGLVGAALVLIGIGYFRYKADIDTGYAECTNQYSAKICACSFDAVINEVGTVRGVLSYAPLFGKIFDFNDVEMSMMEQRVIRQCSAR